jgi:hypothetical protein
MDGFVAGLQPILYEKKQHAIFFLVVVKKRPDVAGFAELGPGERNGRWDGCTARN